MRFFFLIFVVLLVAIAQVQGGGWIRKTRRVIRPRIGPAGAREAAVNIIHLQSGRSASQNSANPWARLFVRRPRFFWTPQIANIRRFRFQPNERRRDTFRQQPILALSKNTRQPKLNRHRIHGIKIEHGSVRSSGARSAWRPIPSGQNPFIRAPTYEYSPPQIERVKVIEAKHRRPSAPNSNKKQSNGHVKHQRGKKRPQKPKFVWNFPRIGGPNFWKYLYAKRRPMNMMMKPSRPFVKHVPTKRPSTAGVSRPVISSSEEMYTKAKIPMMFFRPEESILKPIYQQKPKVSPHQKQKQTPLGTIFVPNHFASSSASVESKEVLPQFKKFPAKQQQQKQQQRLRPDIFSQMLGYMNDDKKHRNVLPPFRPYPKPSRPTILKPQRLETTHVTTTTTTTTTSSTTSSPIEPLIVSSMSSTLAPSDDRVNSFNVGILGDSEDKSEVDEIPDVIQVPKVQTSTSVSMSSSIVDDEPVRPLAVDSSDSDDIIGSDSEIIEDIIQSQPNSITTSSTTSTSTTTARPTTKKSYPTMTPYIRKPRPIFGGKVIQMQNKPKSSTSVETSSWGSGEKLLIHRANSKVKEYKPQFLSNYSQLLSFDKVAVEAKNDDQGGSEIITPSPVSSLSTSNSPVLTSSTTTEKSDVFDPVGLLNSWFGKDTPSSS